MVVYGTSMPTTTSWRTQLPQGRKRGRLCGNPNSGPIREDAVPQCHAAGAGEVVTCADTPPATATTGGTGTGTGTETETETEKGGRSPETDDTARRLPGAGPADRHPPDGPDPLRPDEASTPTLPAVPSPGEDTVAPLRLPEPTAMYLPQPAEAVGGPVTARPFDGDGRGVPSSGDPVRGREGDTAGRGVPSEGCGRGPPLTWDGHAPPGFVHLLPADETAAGASASASALVSTPAPGAATSSARTPLPKSGEIKRSDRDAPASPSRSERKLPFTTVSASIVRPSRPHSPSSPRPSRQPIASVAQSSAPGRPASPSHKPPSRPLSPPTRPSGRRTSPERATLLRSKPDSPPTRTPQQHSPLPPRSSREHSPIGSSRMRDPVSRGSIPRDGTPKRPLSPRTQHAPSQGTRTPLHDSRAPRGHSPPRRPTSTATPPYNRPRSPPRGPAADRRPPSPPRQPRAQRPRSKSPMQIDSKETSSSRDTPSRPPDPRDAAKPPITPIGPRATLRGTPASATPVSGSSETPFAPPTGPKNMVVPTGPRAGGYHHHTPYRGGYHGSSISHPPPQPRPTQVTQQPLVVGPPVKPGGQLLPPMNPEIAERLHRLRVDQAKLEDEVRMAQEKQRKSLLEWEKGERELATLSMRVDILEKASMEGYIEGNGMDGYTNGIHI
ncbi:hypothetical protein H072_7281 [Dactylellina haptotyla CBS 200.50]|uniref:Uncharacterized protein n=1 Tax=Dactylellina haptotyla (strain CBS 200.50) TaxID=1284197 RepID=S8BUI2_DACHA|nr:hypothetical protein H072_7281 [Dactylellina haptotyla CBS 200.50]